MALTANERDAIAAICLLAAFADGQPDDRERARIKAVIDGLAAGGGGGGDDGTGVSNAVYQRVIFKQTDAAREAAALLSEEARRFAFEMALTVCDSDGASSDAERKFLGELAAACGIPAEEAAREVKQVDLLMETGGISDVRSEMSDVGGGAGAGAGVSGAHASKASAGFVAKPPHPGRVGVGVGVDEKEIDGSVLNYSILNGALEMLPQTIASAAIIPLQMKMVYEIGKRYGYTLDRGHIKDFLATAGVGVTSQVVEGFARRLMGGLIQNIGGKVIGRAAAGMLTGIGQKATGAAFSFASTYALGQVAKQYYAGGRKLSAIDLQALFTKQVAAGKGMYEQYTPQIAEQARKVNPMQLLSLVRGS